MASVVACVNLKGGVGKRAIAVNFAAYCGRNDLRTLLVDLDPQTNAKGLSASWLIGTEHLQTLITEHSDPWARYEEVVRNPVRFNRGDLIQIIHDFAEFVKKGNGQPRSESLLHLRLSDDSSRGRLFRMPPF